MLALNLSNVTDDKNVLPSTVTANASVYQSPLTATMKLNAVWEVLRNVFIQALMPSIDNEINLKSVDAVKPEDKRGFFQRLFNLGNNDTAKKKK